MSEGVTIQLDFNLNDQQGDDQVDLSLEIDFDNLIITSVLQFEDQEGEEVASYELISPDTDRREKFRITRIPAINNPEAHLFFIGSMCEEGFEEEEQMDTYDLRNARVFMQEYGITQASPVAENDQMIGPLVEVSMRRILRLVQATHLGNAALADEIRDHMKDEFDPAPQGSKEPSSTGNVVIAFAPRP